MTQLILQDGQLLALHNGITTKLQNIPDHAKADAIKLLFGVSNETAYFILIAGARIGKLLSIKIVAKE